MPKKKTARKKRASLSAENLKPGVRFKFGAFYGRPSVGVEILRRRESGTAASGLPQDRWWSRNLDTDEEGYVVLGPGGILNVDEVLDAGESSGPPRHHATKKSPAQLDREIAAALSQEPSMTTEQIERYRSGRKWGWPADLAFKAATGRPLSRTPGRRSHATIGSHNLNLGQLFDHLGHIYEITKIGRDKNHTVSIARRVRDLFGKDTLIDHRSFPARDFDRQHLRPIDHQTAENRGWPPLVR